MGIDDQVMPHIDQANIACGFHAGDPLIMLRTIKLAKDYNVSIGAHPSYPDLVGFGRRSINCSTEEIIALILYQIAAIDGVAKSHGAKVEYVKPHGALYNDMMDELVIREAILSAIKQYNLYRETPLKLMLQATTDIAKHRLQAKDFNIDVIAEVFADRRYDDEGKLLSRTQKGAVLNKEQLLAQVKQLIEQGSVTTVSGNTINMAADTLCVHGDNIPGVQAIEAIKELLT